jgi:hypothetical protein
MRSGLAVLVALVALVALSTASGSPYDRATPTAVAFADGMHGLLGMASGRSGEIETTYDGGKTWQVVRHTSQRVIAAGFLHDAYYVQLNGGATYETDTTFRQWRRVHGHLFRGYCPRSWSWSSKTTYSADLVDTNIEKPWSICGGQPATGFQAKAVFRGKTRVACTNFADSRSVPCGRASYGGISGYGYPAGIAGAHGGFGIIWPGARGIVYVTRDGGRHWHGVSVVRSDIDSGTWATTVGNTGFVLVWREGHSRLVKTTNAGRSWRVVHRWR